MSFNGSLAFWSREQSGLLSLPFIATIIRKTAYAVQELHNEQRLYLDVNPYTILLSLEGRTDEQVSVQLGQPGVSARTSVGGNRTFPANSLLLYMAPEQWMGHATPATDQYALAVIAYELLTGISPFQGPPAQLMDSHLNVQPQAPSTVNQRVSPALDVVIMNALAKRPEDRFPSIFAFAGALEQAIHYPDTVLISVPKASADGNLRATLPISSTEAVMGTLRTVTLPQGRRISIAIPKGAQEGQTIRLDGFGDPSPTGGLPGAVLLTITVNDTDANTSLPSIPAVSAHTGGMPAFTTFTPVGAEALSRSTRSSWQALRQRTVKTYTSITTLSPRQRMLFLGALLAILLIVVVSGISYFVFQPHVGAIPYPPNSGALVLNDLLQDNSKGYSWPDAASTNGGCEFVQGTYHVAAAQAGAFRYCIAGSTGYDNFAYEVRMTTVKGDGGGIIFRANGASSKFYYFRIGRDGSYALYAYIDNVGTHAKMLTSGTAAAVHTGLNVSNLLAVVAHSNTIDLYINDQRVGTVNDGSYGYGQVGVAAAYDTAPTEVVFSDARVWSL